MRLAIPGKIVELEKMGCMRPVSQPAKQYS
jgi:hypothetical protein